MTRAGGTAGLMIGYAPLPFFAKNLLIFAFVGPGRGVGYRCTGGAGPARRTAHQSVD
jgi:hypothetical protein